MQGLFRYDGLLNRSLSKMVDVACLSLLWTISSLPLITTGAATVALYYTVNKVIRHDRGGIWSEYWKSFSANFKQATPLWLLMMAIIYLLGVSSYSAYLLYISGGSTKWIFLTVLIPFLLITMWAVYIFPSIARFSNPTKIVMKNCLLLAILNLPRSVLLVLIFVISVLLVLIVPMSIIFIPVVYMLLSGMILEKIFRKYMSPEDLAMEQELNRESVS